MQGSPERLATSAAQEGGSLRTGIAVAIALVTLVLIVGGGLFLRLREQPPPLSSTPPAVTPPPESSVPPPSIGPSPPPPTIDSPKGESQPMKPPEAAPSYTPTPPRLPSTLGEAPAGRTDADRSDTPAVSIVPIPPGLPLEPDKIVAGVPPSVLPGAGVVPVPRALEPSPRLFSRESSALAELLDRYEEAYDRLDARGAAAIWPSVDVRALERAFARLQEQNLDFGTCTFAVSENDAAARCAGLLRYARRIGDTAPKTEQHVWTIEFARVGDAWKIVRISAQ